MSYSIAFAPVLNFPKKVHLPGSKSLSNRALICAAMSEGTTVLEHFLDADDTRYMLSAIKTLGYDVEYEEKKRQVKIKGGMIPLQKANIFVGNAGTAMRFLTGFLTTSNGYFTIDGNKRMRERPIADLIDTLTEIGAKIHYTRKKGYPPLEINAKGLDGGVCHISGKNSSQYISSVLLASPLARKGVELHINGEMASRPYIEMTTRIMQDFGINVESDFEKQIFRVAPGSYKPPGYYTIEPDASAASYFLAAAPLLGGTVRVEGLGKESVQGDVAFSNILKQMGCTVKNNNDFISVSNGARLRGIDADMNAIPDMVLTLAVLALFAEGPTIIRNVPNLRIKETDRISALATELRRVGARVTEYSDGIKIIPASHYHAAKIHTYDDHRMAMSFALATLKIPGLEIQNPECVSKTFPDFFDVFEDFLKA